MQCGQRIRGRSVRPDSSPSTAVPAIRQLTPSVGSGSEYLESSVRRAASQKKPLPDRYLTVAKHWLMCYIEDKGKGRPVRWKRAITCLLCVAGAGTSICSYRLSSQLQGDANGDWAVDVLDIQCVITALLSGEQGWSAADVNGDGTIDVLDYQAVLGQANTQGKPVPPPANSPDHPVLQAVMCAPPVHPMPLAVLALHAPPCKAKDQPVAAAPNQCSHRLKHDRYVLGLRPHAPPASC